MPEINYTVLIQIVNFILLLFLLNIIIYRPVRGILNKRNEEMDSSLSLTNEWKRKIDNYSIELEERLDLARKHGIRERLEMRDSGLSHEKELFLSASSQIQRDINEAKNEIRDKIEKARTSLLGEIEGFSKELAEKILGRAMK